MSEPDTEFDPCDAVADYARVRDAIAFISEARTRQPSAEAIAAAVGLSPVQLSRLFQRFAGITPKQFLAAITLDAAKRLLAEKKKIPLIAGNLIQHGFGGEDNTLVLFDEQGQTPLPPASKIELARALVAHIARLLDRR